MRRSALTLATQVVLVCLLVGLVVALVGLKRTVTLSVDGERRTVDTYARTVADVLSREDVVVGEHDVVVPEPHRSVTDGELITYRRARPVNVNIDGQVRQVWTSALEVDEAIRQLGLHERDAFVSVSRSGRIPLEGGVDVTVRTAHTVTVLVDGKRITASTTAASVADLLDELGVQVGPRDVVGPDPRTYPAHGSSVTVSRVVGRTLTRQVAVPYETVRRKNPNLYKGDTRVVREGKPGLLVRRFALTLRDGEVVDRRLVSEKRRKRPVRRVVEHGTKPRPTYLATSSSPNWAALARCESSGRPDAVSPNGMYHGLYQFDLQTWRSVGGTGLPSQAPASEQTYRAQKLYDSRGASPWPVCGKYL